MSQPAAESEPTVEVPAIDKPEDFVDAQETIEEKPKAHRSKQTKREKSQADTTKTPQMRSGRLVPVSNAGHAKKKLTSVAGKKSGTAEPVKVKKGHRYRPGTVALRKIREYQKSTDRLIPHAAFNRLIREIAHDFKTDLRWQADGVIALHEAAETFLTKMLDETGKLALHSGRETIQDRDLQFICAVHNDTLNQHKIRLTGRLAKKMGGKEFSMPLSTPTKKEPAAATPKPAKA
jgi:histone H3